MDNHGMNILILNCGSSSVKFQLIVTDLELIAQNADRHLARGNIERIGGEAVVTLQVEGQDEQRSTATLRDIRAAVDFIARWASSPESGIDGTINGWRVHGHSTMSQAAL